MMAHETLATLIDSKVAQYEEVAALFLMIEDKDKVNLLQELETSLLELKEFDEEQAIPEDFIGVLETLVGSMPSYSKVRKSPRHPSEYDIEQISKRLVSDVRSAIDKLSVWKIWEKVGFFNENWVLVGANGSGKSLLAAKIKETLTTEHGIVINAQKLLILPRIQFIPIHQEAEQYVEAYQISPKDDKKTFTMKSIDTLDINTLKDSINDMPNVMIGLFDNAIYMHAQYYEANEADGDAGKKNFPRIIDRVIKIWNDLVDDRALEYHPESNSLTITPKDGSPTYEAYKMSDGERTILYMVGRILLAKEHSYIIVDEPEMNLHKTIVCKLWDRIEQERSDCRFAYLTHDVEFASTRQSRKLWLKSYKDPDEWDIRPIENNEIPEELLLKVLGSKKKVLFCEGKQDSLDKNIYEVLFPQLTIIPVESCRDVINYVRAFNKYKDRRVNAVGIVDADYRTPEEIEKLNEDGICTLGVAEVENLFMVEEFLRAYLENNNEDAVKLDDIKARVLGMLAKNSESHASEYVSSRINYIFDNEDLNKANSKEEVQKHLDEFIQKIKVSEWYDERKAEIDKICEDKDYAKAIKVYNNKGILACVSAALDYKPKAYRLKALSFFISNDGAKEILRSYVPKV